MKNIKKNKKQIIHLPLIIGVAIFSLCMVLIWAGSAGQMNNAIAWTGGIYAVVCFLFLIFQIYAFLRTHLVYDEDVENVKFKVFEAEKR